MAEKVRPLPFVSLRSTRHVQESLLSETRADLAASARGAHGRVPRNTGEEGLQRRLHDLEKTNHQLLDDLAAASRHHQSLDADFNDKIAALQRVR